MTEPLGLLLADDLIFTSRITGTARGLGLVVKPVRSAAALVTNADSPPTCLLLDLAYPGLVLEDLFRRLDETGAARPRIVAYGSHVDAAGLRAARTAGCDVVLPRSQFVEELPHKLSEWLAPRQVVT
jgi:CheY-like chemotaxis protein